MKRYLNTIVSLGLILGAIGALIVWETYLDDLINTKEVLVAANTLEKNTVVGKKDIKLAKVAIEQLAENAITDPKLTIGKETAFIIRKGQQIIIDALDIDGVVPNADQIIVPIPKEWLISIPGSLRRKDKVNIYEMPTINLTGGLNKALGEEEASSVNNYLTGNGRPIVENIAVAYAKDPSNQEVKPAEQSKLRIDATGIISDLELVLTDQQLNLLKNKALQGYKFILAYK
ncbi:MAG: SAF domain-containing protein [Carboxydocellales bacterium]